MFKSKKSFVAEEPAPEPVQAAVPAAPHDGTGAPVEPAVEEQKPKGPCGKTGYLRIHRKAGPSVVACKDHQGAVTDMILGELVVKKADAKKKPLNIPVCEVEA